MSAYQKEKRKFVISLVIGAILGVLSLKGAMDRGELFTLKGLAIPFILVYPLGIAYSWRAFLYVSDVTSSNYNPNSYFTRREQRRANGLTFILLIWVVFSFGWIIGIFLAPVQLYFAKKMDRQLQEQSL